MSVIIISRQSGLRRKHLPDSLADTLGYYFADEDIILRAGVEVYFFPIGKRRANLFSNHIERGNYHAN